ncbi:STAS domain-containing protein [Paenibacillus sp. MBLB4367]|uniref:STAS domain-containing protein n=1 Tax=Paenibacillus sp. MBLB4367 TaxID=3384767 RepID=UPI0039081681
MVITKRDNIRVLWWDKDITLKNIDDFRLAVWKLLDSDEAHLVLDLRQVAYINSSALGVVADAVLQGRRHQKQLVITGIEPTVYEIFNIVKFGTFIKLFKQLDDAVAYIQTLPAK